jgi:hypothetical protein
MSDNIDKGLPEQTEEVPTSLSKKPLPPEDKASQEEAQQSMAAEIQVPAEKLDELTDWLWESITRAQADRTELDANLVRWEKMYEGEPQEKDKTIPWPGCANLVVPVASTAVDSIFARIINVVFGGKQLWLPQAVSANWADVIEPLGTWINTVGKKMGMYRVCQDWMLGAIKFGTGIMKLPWEVNTRHFVYKDSQGNLINEDKNIYEGPRPYVISLADFLVSPDGHKAKDLQSCEWIANRFTTTKKSLLDRQRDGTYHDVENLFDSPQSYPTDMEQAKLDAAGVSIGQNDIYELWEVWCSYDIDGDGELEELVCTLSLDKKKLIRAVYNFYKHQERPFHVIRYMQREGSFYGIGICQMLESIQEEVTTMHNQRIDNATLSNTKLFLRQQDSNVTDLDIYPGSLIDVAKTGPDGDITALEMGSEHSTMLQEELHTNSYGEKRTGVSDYTVGRESSAIGSRATATSTLALIREGNKRFQMVIMDIRETLSDVAHQVISLYQQFKPNNLEYIIFSEKEKRLIQAFFNLPDEYTRDGIVVDIPTLSDVDNKEVSKQALLTLMQVLTQYYQALFQTFQVALNPQAPQPVKELAITGSKAASKLMERIIEAFDFRDPEAFVADIDSLLALQQQAEAASAALGQNGGGANQGTPPVTGMGGAMQAPQGGQAQLAPQSAGNVQPGGVVPGANPGQGTPSIS